MGQGTELKIFVRQVCLVNLLIGPPWHSLFTEYLHISSFLLDKGMSVQNWTMFPAPRSLKLIFRLCSQAYRCHLWAALEKNNLYSSFRAHDFSKCNWGFVQIGSLKLLLMSVGLLRAWNTEGYWWMFDGDFHPPFPSILWHCWDGDIHVHGAWQNKQKRGHCPEELMT